jgi:hypothetical protein
MVSLPTINYGVQMSYLIMALRPSGTTTHKAKTEEAALEIMDRLYLEDIGYEGFDADGNTIDENSLTDIIDARGAQSKAACGREKRYI